MRVEYQDIIDRAGDPDWYDQNGTPRYGGRAPESVGVYSDQVVFYEIACQYCSERFVVAKTFSLYYRTVAHPGCLDITLERQVVADILFYGDPPHHDACTGNTMSSESVRVLEFWRKTEDYEWERVPELEMALERGEE